MGYHVKSRQLYLSLLWGERYDIDSTHSSMTAISAPAGLSRCNLVFVVAFTRAARPAWFVGAERCELFWDTKQSPVEA